MKTKIELKDMKFYAYHGVLPQETVVGSHFIVNLILTVPFDKATESDRLEDTINYAAIYQAVKEEMCIPSKLLEHAAGRILKRLKKEFPQITETELKLTKLNPPFGGDLHSASVILIDN
ncbi:MAG: dihydroneopterin aldolase [Tannerellaceae bacterium]|nr:dihydroneopterin aldolase [Tannerellaceae bacterium]